jgi:glycosyltransferase involved in cell wall biosynthesis
LAQAACAALPFPVALHLIGMGEPPAAPEGLEVHTHAPVFDREKLREAYLNADVVLVPSRLESFGLVAAEALCVGAPTVVTPAGALPEVLAGHPAGAVAQRMEPSAIADAIVAVAQAPEAQRSERARTAQQQFGSAQFLDAHEQLYARVIAARGG